MKAILTYHSVDESGSPISVTPAAFAGHVSRLRRDGIRVLRLDDLLAAPYTGQPAVAITFDDALVTARPAIERLLDEGLPVTIFVATGHVGHTNDWGGAPQPGIPTLDIMRWSDLEYLRARGADLAPHTRRHPRLRRLSDDAIDEEIGGSIEDLRQRLGTVSRHFAYPYGDVDERVAARAASHCRWAYTTAFRLLRAEDPAMLVPRLDMYYFGRPDALDAWDTTRFAAFVHLVRARRWAVSQVRARVQGTV